jgi:alpha-methylacyl-CoA racemase
MSEAPHHPAAKARNAYVDVGGFNQPAPAPRFSRTVEAAPRPAPRRGANTEEVLEQSGFSAAEIADLKQSGIVGAQA